MAVDRFSNAAGPQHGLIKIVPTGVTVGSGTASVSANGDVNVGSAVSNITVNGAFSATYDNYKILWTGGYGSQVFEMQFQLAGITGTVYYSALTYQSYNGGGITAASGQGVTLAQWVGGGTTSTGKAELEIQNPFLNQIKHMTGQFTVPNGTGNSGLSRHWINSITSATGFTLIPTGGTITGGTIRIYGYNQ